MHPQASNNCVQATPDCALLFIVAQVCECMREFSVDLSDAKTFESFVEAFNVGLCRHVNGEWHGRSWDAFHDYLSWPDEEKYRLTFVGWHACPALSAEQKRTAFEIFKDNPHVDIVLT